MDGTPIAAVIVRWFRKFHPFVGCSFFHQQSLREMGRETIDGS